MGISTRDESRGAIAAYVYAYVADVRLRLLPRDAGTQPSAEALLREPRGDEAGEPGPRSS